MKLLLVGSGGREHAIAWKIAQSPHCQQLWIAPGNAGTAQHGQNIPVKADDVPALVRFAKMNGIDLVIVGPEAALEAGLADSLQRAGIRVFGPTQPAARIETSKAFAKSFMQRHGIPTACFSAFTSYEDALVFLDRVPFPVVLKTSGLAAGKGVILPETKEEAQAALHSMMIERVFGEAGAEIIIEERLSGEEISLLAFSDGVTVLAMPPAQDHKRLLDGDLGPNTGGMGAYAPAPVTLPGLVEMVTRKILQPAVDGLRAEGCPFVGVLYAGLMLTARGPQVLEFNCRFGDPETQVLLPLMDSDLLEVMEACADQRLDQVTLRWKSGTAATVVLASEGYPGKAPVGRVISGLDHPFIPALIFHAGTKEAGGQVLTAGGRVLNVTGLGNNLPDALSIAYKAIDGIHFDGMQFRRDIAHRALQHPARAIPSETPHSPAYTASGVNIEAGNRAVAMMKEQVQSTYTSAVLAGIGAFGGLFDAGVLRHMQAPVLVASTDGVGTKVRLAAALRRYEGIGVDIVNHCIDDILVQGARPLFFMDYFACSKLEPEIVAQVVAGISAACREADCVLLGGETAEMPGVYSPGEFDIAGTIVGVVEKQGILPRQNLMPGDLLIGLASSGPHTNGYSLIRKVFDGVPLDTMAPKIDMPLAEALLVPHRSYLPILQKPLAISSGPIKALAHLTGGGFIENIPRVLPDGLRAVIHLGSWPIPALFALIQDRGQIEQDEMYRVFNMGIGMVVIIAPDQLEDFQHHIPETCWVIGSLVSGEKGITLQ